MLKFFEKYVNFLHYINFKVTEENPKYSFGNGESLKLAGDSPRRHWQYLSLTLEIVGMQRG